MGSLSLIESNLTPQRAILWHCLDSHTRGAPLTTSRPSALPPPGARRASSFADGPVIATPLRPAPDVEGSTLDACAIHEEPSKVWHAVTPDPQCTISRVGSGPTTHGRVLCTQVVRRLEPPAGVEIFIERSPSAGRSTKATHRSSARSESLPSQIVCSAQFSFESPVRRLAAGKVARPHRAWSRANGNEMDTAEDWETTQMLENPARIILRAYTTPYVVYIGGEPAPTSPAPPSPRRQRWLQACRRQARGGESRIPSRTKRMASATPCGTCKRGRQDDLRRRMRCHKAMADVTYGHDGRLARPRLGLHRRHGDRSRQRSSTEKRRFGANIVKYYEICRDRRRHLQLCGAAVSGRTPVRIAREEDVAGAGPPGGARRRSGGSSAVEQHEDARDLGRLLRRDLDREPAADAARSGEAGRRLRAEGGRARCDAVVSPAPLVGVERPLRFAARMVLRRDRQHGDVRRTSRCRGSASSCWTTWEARARSRVETPAHAYGNHESDVRY